MLEALDRANVFIVPLDDHRGWYRYHHLFAEALRARLAAERPDRVPLLHRAASEWYAAHGLPEEAVGHALSSERPEHAADLVESVLPDLRRRRRGRHAARMADRPAGRGGAADARCWAPTCAWTRLVRG